MNEPIFEIPVEGRPAKELFSKEWLVTNGLGGYAAGTVSGVNTRRHHGLFVPNLTVPRGRTMLIPRLSENVRTSGGWTELTGAEFEGRLELDGLQFLKKFRLDWQTPVWTWDVEGRIFEKKIFMPYGSNTVCVSWHLLRGGPLELRVRPYGSCRKHDGPLGYPKEWPFRMGFQGQRYELIPFEGAPVVRLTMKPFRGSFTAESHLLEKLCYRLEFQRGLDHFENLFSPGYFSFELKEGEEIFLAVSTEAWESFEEDDLRPVFEAEENRRKKLLTPLEKMKPDKTISQLFLAADQFIVLPRSRVHKNPMLESSAGQARTVIAGYPWFTDWGRDTMISLEGLTLCTGREMEARAILLTFGHYVRNGLLPNHFFEEGREAIYNTVDATFWYFHALDRYLEKTGDASVLETLYPTLQSIVDFHVRGTDFGIHMDPADGLITAAAEGFQLTWMDAKVDEWVVTPRRGKPVEIQALWYNALCLMEVWSARLGKPAEEYAKLSAKVLKSFNERFWFENGGHLYDVVDTPRGDSDASLRPNQIFAVSLRFPVLDEKFRKSVIDAVEKKLLTPYGLRTLDPADPEYHGLYEGNRWERDAAYHQGLVWTWLIGAFWDARKKVDPESHAKIRSFFAPLEKHLEEEGLGTISEIFDANPPYFPRGCFAQAWSVAEVLRCLLSLDG